MGAMLRLAAMGFVVLSVVYVCLWFYSRAVRRGKLRDDYEPDLDGDFDTYMDKGMEAYHNSLRPKLLLGVYVVPISAVAAIIYFTNFH